MASLLAWVCFGSEQLRIGPGGVEYRRRAVIEFGRRRVPLEEVRSVASPSTAPGGRSGTIRDGVVIGTWGRPVRFAEDVDPVERAWLADLIRRHLQGLSPDRVITLQTDEDSMLATRVEVMLPGGADVGPPSDSEVELGDRTEFLRRRPFHRAECAVITLINLVVKGFVANDVLHLSRHPRAWPMLLASLPWGLCGLAAFMTWLKITEALLQRQTWLIGPGEIAPRTTVMGIGRTRSHDLMDLSRIELRRTAKGDAPYSLGFLSHEGEDLLVIDDLTEGEARWMGVRFCELLGGLLSKLGSRSPPNPSSRSTPGRRIR